MNQKNENLKLSYEFFIGKSVGKTLKEVAVDLIKTDNENLVSRWYHGTPATDLFTWTDQRNNVLKQQLNFNGQVVEWNCLEGIKTGVVIELDMTDGPAPEGEPQVGASETIHFDNKPQPTSVQLALEILAHAEIDMEIRAQIIGNFKDPKCIDNMPPELFLNRFGLALKNYEKQDHGFWQNLKTRFRAIFNKSPR